MAKKCCPKVKEYYSSFEDLLNQRKLDNEKIMKKKICKCGSPINNCTNKVNLPGPYQSPTV